MELALVLMGILGTVASFVLLIKNIIKKNSKKKAIIALCISFILIAAGGVWKGMNMTPEELAASEQAKAEAQAIKQAKADAKKLAEEQAKAAEKEKAKAEGQAKSEADAQKQAQVETVAQSNETMETQAENSALGVESKHKVGDKGISGVTMTESLIKYYNNAESNPLSTKGEAEAVTKEVYVDVTNQDGKMMPEDERMTKLYKAQIYYDKNMNSQYSALNSLLIEEFGGRINGTRTASGAAERMSNIKSMYKMIVN